MSIAPVDRESEAACLDLSLDQTCSQVPTRSWVGRTEENLEHGAAIST